MKPEDVGVEIYGDDKIVITVPESYYVDNYHRQGNITYVTLRPLPET
jgi:hypothetical protein